MLGEHTEMCHRCLLPNHYLLTNIISTFPSAQCRLSIKFKTASVTLEVPALVPTVAVLSWVYRVIKKDGPNFVGYISKLELVINMM
jgi:hypothetical protein